MAMTAKCPTCNVPLGADPMGHKHPAIPSPVDKTAASRSPLPPIQRKKQPPMPPFLK